MVQRRQRERSVFEVLLPDGHKLWPDWLRKIDTLLEDEAVIEGRRAMPRMRGQRSTTDQDHDLRRHPKLPAAAALWPARLDADAEASVRLELRRPGA